ncbi:MAG: NusG domain II-containing protein [Clostridiaceae bacterium]|nr:NusG domain II-containing protein [Clostridiaceae bacterium]
MKSTKYWLIIIGLILAVSCLIAYVMSQNQGRTAIITQNGKELYSIDLDAVDEPYTIEIKGKYTNKICVEHGRIRVEDSDCPDQICVKHGWITEGGSPIVCLPNGLVIEIKGGSSSADTVSK